MRRLLLVYYALFALGCSNSDPIATPVDLIVGIWTVSFINATITVGPQSYVDYLKAQGLSDAEAQALANELTNSVEDGVAPKLEIKKGGAYTSTDAQGVMDSGTWELTYDASTLTLDKDTTEEMIFFVTALSSTNMNLTGDVSEIEGGITVKIHLEIAFTK